MLLHRALTEEDKKEICSWKYEGEYAIYDLPVYEEMCRKKIGFANPQREKNFQVFLLDGIVIGFVNIKEEPEEVFIGIGERPEYCGKGYGRQILAEACKVAKKKFPEKICYLEVRVWNERAIRCYQSVGFVIVGEPYMLKTLAGEDLFYKMVRK